MPKVNDEHANAGLSRQEGLSRLPEVFLKILNITGWMTRGQTRLMVRLCIHISDTGYAIL